MRPAYIALAVSALVIGTSALATTYFVTPDGSGDFGNIQTAVAAVVDGDLLELGDGTFHGPGNRDINIGDKAIAIRSRSLDPTQCIVDCEAGPGNPHFGFAFGDHCGRLTLLEGVTVQHGYGNTSAGIYVGNGTPTIRGCIIRENVATAEGGGLHVWGGAPLVDHCAFIENSSPSGAGAAASLGSPERVTTFDHCVFVGNYGAIEGGAVRF